MCTLQIDYKIKFMNDGLHAQLQELLPIEEMALENESQWQKLMDELVAIRIGKGITQQQVGDSLGVSQAAVAQFEKHSTNPTIARLQLYAIAIGAKLSFAAIDSGLKFPGNSRTKQGDRSSKPGPKPGSLPEYRI